MKTVSFQPVEHPDKMSSYWKRQWKVILCVALFGTAFNAAMPYAALLEGRLIDALLEQVTGRVLLRRIALFLCAVGAIQLARYLKRYFVRLFANRTMLDLRMMLYNNMMHGNANALSGESTGDLMVKAVSDVDICVEGMRKVTTEVFDTGVLMLSYLVTMLYCDGRITLLAGAFIPIALVLAEYLKTVVVRYSKAARAQISLVSQTTYTDIAQVVLQRVNGLEEIRQMQYEQELSELEKRVVKTSILESSMQPVYNVIAMLGIVTVLGLGGNNVLSGVWTVGTFSAYVSIFILLTTKASKAAKLFNSYQQGRVSWQRIVPYLAPYQSHDTAAVTAQTEPRLAVQRLTVCYPKTEQPALQNLSFVAQCGEILVVSGPIACGKSTLAAALGGRVAYGGRIRLNGRELSDYTELQRSEQIAVCPHQPQLLSDTIYNNITLGEGGDISAVLRDVCFLEDLRAMPQGVDTVVGSNGIRLSGGQQARIALARTLYRNASLIILDDPFSAVDMVSEQRMLENLKQRYRDRIILLISHRLTVFPAVDRVLLLHSDKTSEIGTHRELLAQSAAYRALYALQKGGKTDES